MVEGEEEEDEEEEQGEEEKGKLVDGGEAAAAAVLALRSIFPLRSAAKKSSSTPMPGTSRTLRARPRGRETASGRMSPALVDSRM